MVTEAELAGIIIGSAALAAAIYAIIDSRKNTANLKKIPKISTHVEQNEALSTEIKADYLASIRIDVIQARNSFDREIKLADRDETDDQRIRRVFMYIKGSQEANKSLANRITNDVNALIDYLQPDIRREIEGIASMIKYLSGEMVMPPDKLEAAKSWLASARSTVEGMDRLIVKLDDGLSNENKK